MVVINGVQQRPNVGDGGGGVDASSIVLGDDVFEVIFEGRVLPVRMIAVFTMTVAVDDGANLAHRRSR